MQLPDSWKAIAGLCLVLTLGHIGLAEQPNVSKLKQGDKLELQSGTAWESVEFLEKISDTAARVRRKSGVVAVPVTKLRVPEQKPPAADSPEPGKSSPDYPFDSESKDSPPSRTWADRTGNFKVEATLLRVEGGTVVLKRTDGKELSVPLERLSDDDQKHVANFKSTKNSAALAGQASPAGDKAASAGPGDTVEIKTTDFNTAKLIKLEATTNWDYQPDAVKVEPVKDFRAPLARGDVFEKPVRILVAPQEKRAYIVLLNERPNSEYVSRVQACNIGGKADNPVVFGTGWEPLDVSPDGSLILARSAGLLPEKNGELRVHSRDGKRAQVQCHWRPYATATVSEDKIHDSHERGVYWAELIDNEHLATLNRHGDLVMWQIPEAKPLYRASLDYGAIPALSAGNKYLAVAHQNGIGIVRTADGQQVGNLSNEFGAGSAMAFSDDGKRLAVVRSDHIEVWDLEKKELWRDFIVRGTWSGDSTQLTWVTDNHLLLHGEFLIDVERRIPIWKYRPPVRVWTRLGERVLFVDPVSQGMLAAGQVPDKAVLDAAANLKVEDLLPVRPGAEVAIEMRAGGSADEVEAARVDLESRLQNMGMKVAPGSPLHLIASIQPGKAVTVHYRAFGRGQDATYSVPTQSLSLSFQIGDDVLWKYEMSSSPPLMLSLKKDQTIDQAVQEEMKNRNANLSAASFSRIALPAYIAKMSPDPETKK